MTPGAYGARMNSRLSRLLLPCAIALLSCISSHAADPVRVTTDKGELQGKLSDDSQVRIFLGVPYAAPPVGSLRWKPPQPASKRKQVRSAQSYGYRCMQTNVFADMVFHDPGERRTALR